LVKIDFKIIDIIIAHNLLTNWVNSTRNFEDLSELKNKIKETTRRPSNIESTQQSPNKQAIGHSGSRSAGYDIKRGAKKSRTLRFSECTGFFI